MKYLTVAVPCYNSAAYMHNAIESCLILKDEIEVIVVNDGSKDDTDRVGKEYADMYPDTVKYVCQENGGHGEAVNAGLRNATGLYYKVLDSDDWFDRSALVKMVETIKKMYDENQNIDMFIANYVYEKPSENKQVVIRYTNALPENKVFGWHNVGTFKPQQNLLMHSVIYRTELLRKCGLVLPKHTFYVDNLFVYNPLPYVKTMYYMNIDLYRYFIGREDQSVNEKVMISRIDQQLRVNRLMIEACDVMALKSRKLRNYMIKYLTMITTVSTVLLIKSGTKEHLLMKDELWNELKEKKSDLYKEINKSLLGKVVQLDSHAGHKMIIAIYNMSKKIFPFN